MFLSQIDHKCKIIGVSETWLRESSFVDAYQLANYKFSYNNKKNKRGGGTGLYVHNTLQHEIRYDLSLMCDSFESTFIELTNNPKCKKTVIGVIYRPPGQDIDAFLQIFFKCPEQYQSSFMQLFHPWGL